MKSFKVPPFQVLEIISKDRVVRPAYRMTTTRLPEARSSSRHIRSFRIRGRKVGNNPFKMTLYFDNGAVHFDFSAEDDTTQEVMKRIETEQGLLDMSAAKFTLISELMELLITTLKFPEGPQLNILNITSEDRIVRPAFRMIDNVQQPEAMQQPEVVDNVQQPEAMQHPEVIDTMQHQEVIDAF